MGSRMTDATCKTCPHFALKQSDANWGGCRRVAPTPSDEAGIRPIGRFPFVNVTDWCSEHPLRQRDHLAAMAMQAIFSDHAMFERIGAEERDESSNMLAAVALTAHRVADAMLAERAKGQP